MYTSLVNQLDQLHNYGVHPSVVDVLRNLHGQCQAALSHRGPVSIRGSREFGATDGMLNLANYSRPPETCSTENPTNGYALNVECGKSQFSGAVNFDGPVTGLAANAAAICWGKATADFTLGAVGWNSTVPVNVVTDRTGSTTTGDTATVYLRRTETQDPNIRQNDVVAFSMDESGLAVAQGDYMDGRINDIRVVWVDPTGGAAYTAELASWGAGRRGWYTCDGSDGAINLIGRVLYGYDSAGADTTIDTIGETVNQALTATFNGSSGGSTVSTNGTSITLNQQFPASGADTATAYAGDFSTGGFTQTHSHTIDKSTIAGAIQVAGTTVLRPDGRAMLFVQRLN